MFRVLSVLFALLVMNSGARASRAGVSLRVLSVLLALLVWLAAALDGRAQRRHPSLLRGNEAIVIDERLAALRAEPSLAATLVRRLGRGRVVQLLGPRRMAEGVLFERVAVTRRTRGWVQRDALASPFRVGDDQRLFNLIRASRGFDRIARAQLFLRHFARSPHRPAVLFLLAEAAERAAEDLSRDALGRLNPAEMAATSAPAHSYFMNYVGLDRYNRQGVRFVWDARERRFRYDGAGWRELVRRYPHTPEAEQARRHLAR